MYFSPQTLNALQANTTDEVIHSQNKTSKGFRLKDLDVSTIQAVGSTSITTA